MVDMVPNNKLIALKALTGSSAGTIRGYVFAEAGAVSGVHQVQRWVLFDTDPKERPPTVHVRLVSRDLLSGQLGDWEDVTTRAKFLEKAQEVVGQGNALYAKVNCRTTAPTQAAAGAPWKLPENREDMVPPEFSPENGLPVQIDTGTLWVKSPAGVLLGFIVSSAPDGVRARENWFLYPGYPSDPTTFQVDLVDLPTTDRVLSTRLFADVLERAIGPNDRAVVGSCTYYASFPANP